MLTRQVSLLFCVCLIALLVAGGCMPLLAQQDGFAGTVLDAAGNALPNATVLIKHASSDFSRTLKTDGTGRFSASGLPGGLYSVEVSAPGFSTVMREGLEASVSHDLSFTLSVATLNQTVTVEAAISRAAEAAPSQASLDARSAQSLISPTYIRNFISPVGDYSDVLQMSPGTFSVSSNGQGLGDTKTFFRGFKDGFYNMTFDGIPFNDTNDPTHHSWVWFPGPFIGSTAVRPQSGGRDCDRAGEFRWIDQSIFRETCHPTRMIQGTVSYGSFNTRLFEADYDSGPFGGKDKKSNLLLDAHRMFRTDTKPITFRTGRAVRRSISTEYPIRLC